VYFYLRTVYGTTYLANMCLEHYTNAMDIILPAFQMFEDILIFGWPFIIV